jgi:hypothetical protein
MNDFKTIVFGMSFRLHYTSSVGFFGSVFVESGEKYKYKLRKTGDYYELTAPNGDVARSVHHSKFTVLHEGETDDFKWIAFCKDKGVIFSNGNLRVKQPMRKGERIRVIAEPRDFCFLITTAMGWKTTLVEQDFRFVVAPKPVIESFPPPFPGLKDDGDCGRMRWRTPNYFNGIPVVGTNEVVIPTKEKRQPMVRLSLRQRDIGLVYEIASFTVE